MLGFLNFVFQQIIGAYSEQFGKDAAFFRGLEQIALPPILKQTVVLHSFGPASSSCDQPAFFSQQYKLIGKNHICPPVVLIVVLIF